MIGTIPSTKVHGRCFPGPGNERCVSGSRSVKSDDLKYSVHSQRQDPCTGTESRLSSPDGTPQRTRALRRTPLGTPPYQGGKGVELFCRCGGTRCVTCRGDLDRTAKTTERSILLVSCRRLSLLMR